MAPVLAIADMVASRHRHDDDCDAVGETQTTPSRPGRSWSHAQEEHQNGIRNARQNRTESSDKTWPGGSGVDLTRIDGIDVGVAQTVISEVGLDMTRWQTEAHFASWLGLCPDNRVSGNRVLRKGNRHVVNRAATALRLAATTLLRSQSYLGAQYRRLRGKLRRPKSHHGDGP